MRITITMETGNEAFLDIADVGRALAELARRIAKGQAPTKVMDDNGNAVGTIEYDDPD